MFFKNSNGSVNNGSIQKKINIPKKYCLHIKLSNQSTISNTNNDDEDADSIYGATADDNILLDDTVNVKVGDENGLVGDGSIDQFLV